MKEIFTRIPEYPDYWISTKGRIKLMNCVNHKKSKKGTFLNTYPVCGGYMVCNLYKDGANHTKLVHRLVASAFLPNPDNLRDVDHINFNRQDNSLDNLQWLSHKDNCRRRKK